jgi:hypothetical protein
MFSEKTNKKQLQISADFLQNLETYNRYQQGTKKTSSKDL